MIKTITKHSCVCDMCGRDCGGSISRAVVPKDVFEFVVNLEGGAKTIQICPACQIKLRSALEVKLFNDLEYSFDIEKGEKND